MPIEIIEDANALEGRHTVIEPPLQLRKWTGTASEGRTTRIGIKDAPGDKVGFVQESTGYLFLAVDESLRSFVRTELDRMGVPVTGPPIELLDSMPWLTETYLSPGTYGRVKFLSTKYSYKQDSDTEAVCIGQDLYDRRTGERLPPANMGQWYATHAVLSLCYQPWRDAAVGHLRRLGAVLPDQDPPLQGVDYEFPNDGWQSFTPEAPPSWAPRTLTADELTAALREQDEPRTAADEPDNDGLEATCWLSDTGWAELPPELAEGLNTVIERRLFKPNPYEHLRPVDDPRGWYRAWEPQRGYRTPDWKYDARGITGRLPDEFDPGVIRDWLATFLDYGDARETVAAAHSRLEWPALWQCAEHETVKLISEGKSFTLLPGTGTTQEAATTEYLASRLWRLHRKDRDLIKLSVLECAICSSEFNPRTLDPLYHLVPYGPPRYCPGCCYLGWGSPNEGQMTVELALAGIANLAETIGHTPQREWFKSPIPRNVAEDYRDKVMLARMAAPRATMLADLVPGRSWVGWLQAAGVVGDVMRGSRGTVCVARDGHRCRSLLELSVDDFLHFSGIGHAPEPGWPWHPNLNPGGGLRADWELEDGTFVELAGLSGDAGYDAKMARKRLLADASGIDLLVIEPDDVLRLPIVFDDWL